jgi:hypothetical protein
VRLFDHHRHVVSSKRCRQKFGDLFLIPRIGPTSRRLRISSQRTWRESRHLQH